MFLSKNKKNNVYPCKPQFYYIKVAFKWSTLYRHVFVMHCFEGCVMFMYGHTDARIDTQTIDVKRSL